MILTEGGRDKIQEELNFLVHTERNRLIGELSDAKDRDGVEENSEYQMVKEEYSRLQGKIAKLQDILANSKIIRSENLNTDKVSILSNVRVLNLSNNKEMSFMIVPENEIDIKSGKISPNSPIGSGLIGKEINDIFDVITPGGKIKFKILEISL